MNRKQKIIVSITGIFIVMLALVGLTYAYFLTRITGNENDKSISVTTANLELLYADGTTTVLEPDTKLIPSSTEVGTKDFTVTNNGEDTSYTVLIEDTETYYATNGSYKDEDGSTVTYNANDPTEFESNDFRYTLSCKKYDKAEYTADSETAVSTGECDGISEQKMFPIDGGVMVSNNILSTEVHVYELKFWYIDTGHDQSKDMNKTYNAKVNIVDIRKENPYAIGEENVYEKSLAYNIINNALLKTNGTELMNKPLTIPVVEKSYEDEKILSVTQDNLGTTYYYRGAVQDNYVLFNNMCFRIVRIEGDGSIKLTLAGEVSEGATDCTGVTDTSAVINNGASVTYGYKETRGLDGNTWYMADYENDGKTSTNPTGNTSTSLKELLDAWFNSKFKSEGELTAAGNKVKNDEWCLGGNDNYKYHPETGVLLDAAGIQAYYDENDYYYWHYSPAKRMWETTKYTDLTCGDTEDSIMSRVGAMTGDEVALAGADGNWSSNETYYLFENAKYKYYWTLSRAYFSNDGDSAFYVGNDGDLYGHNLYGHSVYDCYPAVRPSVTLVTNTKITKGTGIKGDPYIIDIS